MNKVRISTNFNWEGKPIEVETKTTQDGKPYKIYDFILNGKQHRDSLNLSKKWINCEVTLKEMFNLVREGHPISTQLLTKEGQFFLDSPVAYRNAKNFVRSSVVMVDVDYGPRIEEVQAHNFYKQYGTGIYTSASHTEEKHRFRVVFRLETDVEDGEHMRFLQIALIEIFNGDPKCKDRTRLFYGAVNCWTEINEDRFIPDDVQARLIVRGRKLDKKKQSGFRIANGEVYTTQSELYLDPEQPLFLRNGSLVYLKDVKGHVSDVRCPFHTDKNGSEFLDYSEKSKSVYFVCAKCNNGRAIWPRRDKANTKFKEAMEEEGWDVIRYSERFVQPIEPYEGVSFVKSPKGTGKTYQLELLVEGFKKQGLSVLLIGHRVSLLKGMAQRLGLKFYLDYKDNGSKRIRPPLLAICANSLKMISSFAQPYDVIILDESEQVLQHMAGDTLLRDRERVVIAFYQHIQKAKQVYCLDADLGMLTVEQIYDLIGTRLPYRSIINEWKTDLEASMWDSKPDLIQHIYEAVKAHKKVFITTNSKKLVDREAINIEEMMPGIKILKITSETSKDLLSQAFFSKPDKFAKEYQVIITSPSTSTGVDINTRFDAVYGIFESKPSTHYDIDQQLWRVRNCDEQHVWIAPQYYNRQESWETIKEGILGSNERTNNFIGNYEERKSEPWVEKYLNLVSRVEAHRNESMNRLRENWARLKTDGGWTIKWVEKQEPTEKPVVASKEAHQLAYEKRIQSILTAHKIDEIYYYTLKNKKGLTSQEKGELERFEIERFFKVPVTQELITLYDDGFASAVKRYEWYTASWEELQTKDTDERLVNTHITDRHNLTDRFILTYTLLNTVGLENLSTDVEITKHDLLDFIETVRECKNKVEAVLGLAVKDRSEKDGYEMQVLNSVLEKVGVKLVNSRKVQWKDADGKKKATYYYRLDLSWIEQLEYYKQLRLTDEK